MSKMPWDDPPAPVTLDLEPVSLAMQRIGLETLKDDVRGLAELFEQMQADVRFMVTHTAVLVRSNNEALRMVFNTERGQSMPEPLRCTFQDGTTMEFQDIGMPQPRITTKTIKEIVETALEKALALGLRPS